MVKILLTVLTLLMLMFSAPVYADQQSNEPEEAPNEAEEDSKGDDFMIIQKIDNQRKELF